MNLTNAVRDDFDIDLRVAAHAGDHAYGVSPTELESCVRGNCTGGRFTCNC